MKQKIQRSLVHDIKALRVLTKAILRSAEVTESVPGALQRAGLRIMINQVNRLCEDSKKLQSQLEAVLCHE